MEQINHAPDMLDLMQQPAFCVKGGNIIRANQPAVQRQIPQEGPVSQILTNGKDEYETFPGGCLYLTVFAGGCQYGASVTRMTDMDVFLLEEETEKAELHAMSLAAQQLREPLAGIITTVDRLFPHIPETASLQASQINQRLFQMLRLLNNMSDAGRYTKNTKPVMETQNLRSLFDELLAASAALVSQTGRILHYNGLTQDVYCLANKELLERALYNLLSNAIKFSSQGADIRVSVTRKKEKLHLTVEDSGDGITPDMRGNVFSSFLREPGITDGRYGLGLGMVLVRAAACAHNGAVLVEQPASGGTKITMTIGIRHQKSGTVKSNILTVDYAGEQDHGLIELSDSLPASAYKKIN